MKARRAAGFPVLWTRCIGLCGSAQAQTQSSSSPSLSPEANWKLCDDKDPEISIAGCNAVIQSRRDKGRRLATAYAQRGTAYLGLQDYDRALQDFSEAIKTDPTYAKAFANRGAVYAAKQEFDEAIKDFDAVVKLEPKNPNAFYDRASMFRLTGEFDRAIQDYTAA